MTRLSRTSMAVAALAAVTAAGCAVALGTPSSDRPGAPAASTPSGTSEPESARLATPAASQRVRFEPERVVLPGGASATVVAAGTEQGLLQVPDDVRRVGWWTGSADVGDPFGSTVLAGHVDSADRGIGFFARLLAVEKGDRIVVHGGGHRAAYRVRSTTLVARDALADDGAALDQTGPHRLVLITCAGRFRPDRGGYESNLVVVADPVGRVD